jgi:heme-degrading monooxygenase HmoA
MSFIGVTRLRVRSIRFLPPFTMHFLRTRRQVRKAPGFQGGSLLADRSWTFWTMTAWDSQESMRRYMTTAPHRATMPYLLDWCDEASVVHWNQPEAALPSWLEADKRMRENGRASKVRNPSPEHATLSYQPPRVTAAGKIAPKRPK